jgi:hypothetical protein
MPINENLSVDGVKKTFREVMKALSATRADIDLTKDELKLFVLAADQWVTDNVASVYTAVPVGIRNKLPASFKAELFIAIIRAKMHDSPPGP